MKIIEGFFVVGIVFMLYVLLSLAFIKPRDIDVQKDDTTMEIYLPYDILYIDTVTNTVNTESSDVYRKFESFIDLKRFVEDFTTQQSLIIEKTLEECLEQ